MKGYTTDQEIMQEHIDRYKGLHRPHVIELSKLCVILPGEKIIDVVNTPHYQYMLGNHEVYIAFLHQHYAQHAPFEHQLKSLDVLMNDESDYLDEKFHDGFVMYESDFVIIDGVHRAARLLHLGVDIAPVLEYQGGGWDVSRRFKI